jgi:L-ribulokinase
LLSPGEQAGELSDPMARKLGLPAGIPVSAAVIDAHAGVPGAGVAEAGTLVMVLGTSSCHMLNAVHDRFVPGVAGVVEGGILPGFFGYETGQAAVGDAFDWIRRLLGHRDFTWLTEASAALPPGSEGVACLDWMNGCRTPLMDGSLRGAFTGLSLGHGPHHLYRALLEASACGLRWIVEILQESGVPVRKYVATGGLPHHNPLMVQLYADVLGKPIAVHPSQHGPALGAAILGVLAAGPQSSGFRSTSAAIRAMAGAEERRGGRALKVVKPDRKTARTYDTLYQQYRVLTEVLRK